ncbi:hypothetical protein pb186bvf_004956 [Paramecium bursaria]
MNRSDRNIKNHYLDYDYENFRHQEQKFYDIHVSHVRFGSHIKFRKLRLSDTNIQVDGWDGQTIAFDCQSNKRDTKHNRVTLDLFGEKIIQYNPTTHKIQSQIFINSSSQNIVLNCQILKLWSRQSGSVNINLRNKKLKLIRKYDFFIYLSNRDQQDKQTIKFNGNIQKIEENKEIVFQQGQIVINERNQKIDDYLIVSHLNIIHNGDSKAYCPSYRYLIEPILQIIAFTYKDKGKLNIVNYVNLQWKNIAVNHDIKFILPIYYGIIVVSQNYSKLKINIIHRNEF